MIKAVIFDVDGLLIDSEPLWREAEQKVFATVGIQLTDEMCKETMGIRSDEIITYWYKKYPWNNLTPKQVEENLLAEVRRLILDKGRIMPGVDYIFSFFRNKQLPMALASSSPYILIDAAIEKMHIAPDLQAKTSAQDEELGKPDPAVYLSAAKKLGIAPENCLAFEDSYNGFLAAHRAGMKTVVIPDPEFMGDPRFARADLVSDSLEEFTDEHLQVLN